jgi:ankyrin repeat protein
MGYTSLIMKKPFIVLLVVLTLFGACAYWVSTRVKMSVEHPETPEAETTSEAPKEDPALIVAIRNSIKTPENNANIAQLLQQGADANAVDLKGRPALYWAIVSGDRASIEALLKAGADINKSDMEMKWTPLMHAVYMAARDEKATPIVGLLIEKGADVNANPRGYTALHVAVNNGEEKTSAPVVDLLLRNGANPNAEAAPSENGPGVTPLMDAAREGKIKLAKLLEKAGARLDVKGPGGRTPSEIASENQHPELAQALKVAAVVEKPAPKKKGKR